MQDALDQDGIWAAIKDAGLDLPDRPHPTDLDGRLVNVFLKCEASPGRHRCAGRRNAMLDDSDVHWHRQIKSCVGGVDGRGDRRPGGLRVGVGRPPGPRRRRPGRRDRRPRRRRADGLPPPPPDRTTTRWSPPSLTGQKWGAWTRPGAPLLTVSGGGVGSVAAAGLLQPLDRVVGAVELDLGDVAPAEEEQQDLGGRPLDPHLGWPPRAVIRP